MLKLVGTNSHVSVFRYALMTVLLGPAARGNSPSPSPELHRSPEKVATFNETSASQNPPKPRSSRPSPQWLFDVDPVLASSNAEAEGSEPSKQRKTSLLASPEKPQAVDRASSIVGRHKHKPVVVSRSPSSGTLLHRRPENASFFEGPSTSSFL